VVATCGLSPGVGGCAESCSEGYLQSVFDFHRRGVSTGDAWRNRPITPPLEPQSNDFFTSGIAVHQSP
jgi:hypothetical protein